MFQSIVKSKINKLSRTKILFCDKHGRNQDFDKKKASATPKGDFLYENIYLQSML